jgi:hypothetical protein
MTHHKRGWAGADHSRVASETHATRRAAPPGSPLPPPPLTGHDKRGWVGTGATMRVASEALGPEASYPARLTPPTHDEPFRRLHRRRRISAGGSVRGQCEYASALLAPWRAPARLTPLPFTAPAPHRGGRFAARGELPRLLRGGSCPDGGEELTLSSPLAHAPGESFRGVRKKYSQWL